MLPFPKTTVWIGSAALLFFLIASSTNAMTTTTSSSSPTTSSLTKTESDNAKIWNRFANGYAQSPIKDMESYETKLALTRQYFKSSTRALEFGCGTGGTALLHAPYVQHYDAIDVSSRMIDIAQSKQKEEQTEASNDSNKVDNVHFHVQGLDSWQAPDASYDVVLGLSILHLLPNRVQAIRKVHRLLKPGGVFVSSTVCMGDMGGGVATVFKLVGPPLAFLGVIPNVQVLTKATLRQDLMDNGFAVQEEFHPGPDKAVFLIAKKKVVQ